MESSLFVAVLSLMIASVASINVIMQGVEVEQVMDYAHVDYNSIANEFDLLDPSRISFAWEEEESRGNEKGVSGVFRKRRAVEGWILLQTFS